MKRTRHLTLSIIFLCFMLILGCTVSASAASTDPTVSAVQTDKNIKAIAASKGLYAPYLASAKAKNYKSIQLVWTPTIGSSGYYLYYSNSKNGSYKKIATINKTYAYSATVNNCQVGKTYYFKLKAFKGSKTSNYSRVLSSKTVDTRPSVTLSKYGKNGAKLQWNSISGAAGYQVYRASGSSNTYTRVATLSSKTYINTGLKSGTYRYVVRAYYNICGTCYGSFSPAKSIKITSTATANAKYRALIVGNGDYPGYSSDLNGPTNDVTVMNNMLTRMKTPYTCTARRNQTKSQILNAISTTFSGAKASDVSLFYYSGHGVTSSGVNSGALWTVDQKCLTTRELANALNKIPGHIIVILDSCGSGASVSTKGADAFNPNTFASSVYSAFASVDSTAKAGELATNKFTVIAAAAPRTTCLDSRIDGYAGGLMTGMLARGAGCSYPNGSYSGSMPADNNSNGKLTLAEIYSYVQGRVSGKQTTTVYPSTSSSYNVFIRK